MLEKRVRLSENINKRQKDRPFYDIRSNGANIPMPNENWSTRWCTLPLYHGEQKYKEMYEFEVKEDDVYVVTFPKSGTTWIQEATWLLVNNLDYDTATTVHIRERSLFMEFVALYPNVDRNTLALAREAPSPRVLKSHLPAHLLPKQIWEKKAKIVYCSRNPKDMAVSFFHFHRGIGSWEGSIDDFVEDIINDDITYAPYWDHLKDFWQMRHEENIFFTTFEDMKRDLGKVLRELNRFLGKPELSEEDCKKLQQHLAFENMKANPCTNLTFRIRSDKDRKGVRNDFEFMRRGEVGSYKDELSVESQNKLDKWIAMNLSKHNLKLQDIFKDI